MDPIRLAFSSDFREEQSEAQRDELTQITQQQAERQDSASYEFSDPINALICVFTSHSAGRGAQSREADSHDDPALTKRTVCCATHIIQASGVWRQGKRGLLAQG